MIGSAAVAAELKPMGNCSQDSANLKMMINSCFNIMLEEDTGFRDHLRDRILGVPKEQRILNMDGIYVCR